MLPVIEALNHIAVLIVDQVAILSVCMHEVPSSITLLLIVYSLSSLLIILQVESVIPLLLLPTVLTSFLFFISKVLTILVVQAIIQMHLSLLTSRIHCISKLHFLLWTSDVASERSCLVLVLRQLQRLI